MSRKRKRTSIVEIGNGRGTVKIYTIILGCLYGFSAAMTDALTNASSNHKLPRVRLPPSRGKPGEGVLFAMMGTWNFELVNSKFDSKLELELSKIEVSGSLWG